MDTLVHVQFEFKQAIISKMPFLSTTHSEARLLMAFWSIASNFHVMTCQVPCAYVLAK